MDHCDKNAHTKLVNNKHRQAATDAATHGMWHTVQYASVGPLTAVTNDTQPQRMTVVSRCPSSWSFQGRLELSRQAQLANSYSCAKVHLPIHHSWHGKLVPAANGCDRQVQQQLPCCCVVGCHPRSLPATTKRRPYDAVPSSVPGNYRLTSKERAVDERSTVAVYSSADDAAPCRIGLPPMQTGTGEVAVDTPVENAGLDVPRPHTSVPGKRAQHVGASPASVEAQKACS